MTGLLLKPLTPADVSKEYVSWLNDPGITEHLSMRFRSKAMTAEEVRAFVDSCQKQKRYHWGIYFEGRHVGNVSCSLWSLDNRSIDISYLLGDNTLAGKGITTRAVGAAINYLISVKGFHRVSAGAAAVNTGSIKVMEKLGLKLEGRLRENHFIPATQKFEDSVAYGILSHEWKIVAPTFKWLADVKVEPMGWENSTVRS